MSENHEIIMQAKHIVKQFPASHGRTLTACNDVNLTMYKGRTLGIVGESGCGKSTFVRMVISLDQPTSGEVLYHGKNITGLSKKETWENRQNLQMVFQDPLASFNPKMKIRDILTEPLMNYKRIKRSERTAKAKELLRMVELPEEFVDRYPHNMSGGQRQRISIARALSLEPEILVCDEATSALDPQITKGILALLLKINKELGITIVVVTHQMEVVKEICNKVAFLKNGKMIAAGKPEELFVAPNKDVQEFVGDSVEFLPKDGVNVRLFFNDETASDSAITHLAHDLGINFGICQGKLENFRGTIMGSLVINVTEADKERVTAWLTDRGILWEVLENV